MRTKKEVHHEALLIATLIVFFRLLLRPDDTADAGWHGSSRTEAPHCTTPGRPPATKIGRYTSGFV